MTRQFRDTNPSAKQRRKIVFRKLKTLLSEFYDRREEMEELAPPECKAYLNSRPLDTPKPGPLAEIKFELARLSLNVPRIGMPPADKSLPNSADNAVMEVPYKQLQLHKYTKAVEEREKHQSESSTFRALEESTRFMASCPSLLETWTLEKEGMEYHAGYDMLQRYFYGQDDFNHYRGKLRARCARAGITLAERRIRLLKSGGRGSPLWQVISADEDWPQ